MDRVRSIMLELKEVNATVSVEGDHLRIEAEKGAINDELKQQIKINKESLISYIKSIRQEKSYVIPVVDQQSSYVLSSSQQSIWVMCQFEDGNIACNMPGVYVFEGNLDSDTLLFSFRVLIQRHESLRTVFRTNESGEPRQFIRSAEETTFDLWYRDVRNEAEKENAVSNIIQQEFIKPFDITAGPLLRAGLIQTENNKWLFTYVMHHIITDGWSMNNLVQELLIIYNAHTRKAAVPLTPLRIQYKDYAAWQQSILRSEASNVHRNYWQQQFSGRLPVLTLPLDHPRPAIKTYNGRTLRLNLDEQLTTGLKHVCQQNKATLFMGLLATINVLLYRYTNQKDIIIGTPIAGREDADLEDQIGFYLNTLALRAKFSGSNTFNELLQHVKQVTLDAYEHQMYPFDALVEELQLKRHPDRNILFDVMVLLQNMDVQKQHAERNLGDVTVRNYEGGEYVISKNDLIFYFSEAGGQINCNIEYNTDLFNNATIERLSEYLVTLLTTIVRHADHKVDELVDESLRVKYLPVKFNTTLLENTACSEHQKRLWFIDQFESNFLYEKSPVYHNVPHITKFSSGLDPDVLGSIITCVVQSFPILRTRIHSAQNEPYQVIEQEINVALQQHSWNGALLRENLLQLLDQPFDINQDDLIRFHLVKYEEDKYLFVILAHHLIIDRRGLDVLFNNIMSRYRAAVDGTMMADTEIYQYAQYAQWQNAMSAHELEASALYWKHKLEDLPVLYLDTDTPREHIHIYKAGHCCRQLTPEQTAAIMKFSDRNNTTPFTLLLAAFNALLHRYSGSEEIVIGTLYENRREAGLPELIGPVANLLTLRNRIADDTTLHSLLRQVAADYNTAIASADMPFEKVVLEVNPGKDMSRTALFDVLFHYEDYEPDPDFELVELNHGLGKYDLNLLAKKGNDFELYLTYNEKYFDRSRIERLLDHLTGFLLKAIAAPDLPLIYVDYMSRDEKDMLLGANDTQAGWPADQTIVSLFNKQVALTPDNIAVVFEQTQLTYRELDEHSTLLGCYLRTKYAITADDLIGIKLPRSEWQIISILGILKAGGAYVPVDPAYPQDRIDYMVNDSKCKVVIDEAELELFNAAAGNYNGQPLPVINQPEDLAYVIYTSGTTGNPKGTLITHRNVVRLFKTDSPLFDFNANDVWTMFHSYCFDFSVWEMYGALLYGGRVVVVPALTAKDPEAYLRLLREQGVTILNQTPSVFYNLIKEELQQEASSLQLRYVIFGGEALSPVRLKDWQARYPDTRLINMYGITETTVHVTYKEITKKDIENNTSSIGKAIPTLRCYILDRHQQLLPIGVSGELCVGGEGVCRGYLNKPALTSQRFITDTQNKGGRLYRSGDKARVTITGELEYTGRIDDQVKVRGYRIELGEIENVLRGNPDVDEAVVIARTDEKGENNLFAYVVGKQTLNTTSLRLALAEQLPAYMLPAGFIKMDRLPITSNGKVDKKNLPDPTSAMLGTGVAYIPARNETEATLTNIWKDLLGVEKVSVKDNFFDLGGHSLKATRLISQIHKLLDVKIALKDIFTNRTLEDLALLIRQSSRNSFSSISPIDKQDDYVLSSSQQRLWLLSQTEEANIAYNMPGAYILEGDLNTMALEKAFFSLLHRHEILRTVFRENQEGDIRQVVLDPAETGFSLHFIDMRGQQEQALKTSIQRDFGAAFDLAKGPLLKAAVYQLDDKKWVFTYVMHHIISDGWSMEILMQELLACYNMALNGDMETLSPLRIQYKDFAAWQQQELRGEALQQHSKYWLAQFSGTLPVLEFPADKLRPAIKTYNGGVITKHINADLTGAVRLLGHEKGSTLYMALLALVNVLLHRYTGQTDFIIGSPVAGRQHTDLEGQIGFYINTLPLRAQFSKNDSFNELLANIRQVTLGAYEHQVYPFDRLVEELMVERDPSRGALFDVMMTLQNTGGVQTATAAGMQGVHISRYLDSEHIISKSDLTFNFVETGNALHLSLEYNSDIYNRESVARLADHFELLTGAVINTPAIPMAQLDYLSTAEKEYLSVGLNNSAIEYPAAETVVSLFEKQVKSTPHHAAVIFEDTSITYDQLNDAANRLAACLHQYHTVQQGDLIGIKLQRSEKVIVAMLAILKSGAAYVPIDPEYPQERIDFIAADCNCKLIIDDFLLAQFNELAGQLSNTNPITVTTPQDLAYVIYTSGSTGQPKGVMVHHGGIVRLVKSANYVDISDTDKILNLSNFSFDGSVFDIFGALLNGAALVIPLKEVFLDVQSLGQLIYKEGISIFFITTALFNVLADNIFGGLEKLRYLLFGGERVSVSHVKRFRSAHPHVNLVHVYGPTENTTFSSWYPVKTINDDLGTIPIGKAISNAECYILHEYNGALQLAPIGVVGEICVGGAGVAKGYLNQPVLTAEKFVDNPFRQNEKIYKTGDWGRWLQDGNIEFVGRKDDQVKIRGFRIELGEIENAIAAFEMVDSVVVAVRADAAGENSVVAYLVGSESLDILALRAWLSDRLPEYMIPAYFHQMESLPLNSNGKVDKKQLPDPASITTGNDTTCTVPRNETEEKLLLIWQELLSRNIISVDQDFFDLGGHSLKITRLSAKIHKEFEVKLPVKALYANSTLASQALLIQSVQKTVFNKIMPVALQASYPLSAAQRRLWVLSQFEEGSVAYNMPGVFVFEGTLDRQALDKAFDWLITRHESLRTVFREDEQGEIRQVVLSPADAGCMIRFVDLRGVDGLDAKLQDLVQLQALTPFDLSAGPLVHATLYRIAEHKYVFAYVMHHIISDGWSMGILMNELQQLYNAGVKGEDNPLRPLRIQYKDYAAWQQERLSGAPLETHRSYWLNKFAGTLPVLQLPADNIRPPEKTFNGGLVNCCLDAELCSQLKAFANGQGGTLFMALLATLNALFFRYTSQEDIIIGSPIAGREHDDLEDQIGFYVNTLALRSQFKGNYSYLQLFETIKEITLGAYEHQIYPFDELVDELQVQRDMSRSPLFDVLLVLQNMNLDNALSQTMENIQVSSFNGHSHVISKFDLTFYFAETGDDLQLTIEYNSDIYHQSSVQRLAAHFVQLMKAMLVQPAQSIDQIDYLSEAEKEQVCIQFNNTDKVYPAGKTLITLFEEQVALTPENSALVFDDNYYTYRQVNELSNQFAAYLRKQYHIQADDTIGVMMSRNEWMVIAMIGILKSGAACVPLDMEYPKERLAYMTDDSQCKTIIDAAAMQQFLAERDNYSINNPASVNLPGDLIYIIYTSGSTGKPKGCMLENKGVINHLFSKIDLLQLNSASAICHNSELYFVGGIWQLWAPLVVGGKVVLCNSEELKSIEKLLTKAATHKATMVEVIPSQLNEYLSYEKYIRLDHINTLILTGERLNMHFVNRCYAGNDHLQIINTYGQTESSDVTCSYKIPRDGQRNNVLIGSPIQNTRIYILSPGGMLCPVGVFGEICTVGDGISRGYINKQQLTSEKFVTSPLYDGRRMYKTGDIARWLPDGTLELLGRKDDQVKIRGFRIEPWEIESALLQMEPVTEAVLLTSDGAEEGKQLVAFIVADHKLDAAQINSFLNTRIPHYMIPASYVQLDKIPLLQNGKVNKKELSEYIGAAMGTGVTYEAPSNEWERKLAKIWEEVLKKQEIGIHDNFFLLGGHSLKATRLAGLIHKVFDVKIGLKELFTKPVLQDQAAFIQHCTKTAFDTITVAAPRESYPLSAAQRRLWVMSQFEAGTIAYNMPGVYVFEGNLNNDALEYAFLSLINRHEILRTVFREDQHGEVRQFIRSSEETGFRISHYDYRLNDTKQQQLPGEIQSIFMQPFSLVEGPLLRADVFRVADDKWIFVYVMHHIISDAWSMGVLFNELLSLYNAFISDETPTLPSLPIQYKDYAVWEQQRLTAEVLASHKSYWLEQFKGELPVLEMPADKPRPEVKKYNGQIINKRISARLLQGLRTLGQEEGATLFMSLLALVNTLLYKYTGQEDIIVGSPIAGREREELENQLGFYINTIALRSGFKREDNFRQLLQQVRRTTLEGYEHQAYPFDELVDALSIPRDVSRNPLFDVWVVLQDSSNDSGPLAKPGELKVSTYEDAAYLLSRFDLHFNFVEIGDELNLALMYNSDIYHHNTVMQLANHLEQLTAAVITHADNPLYQLDYLTEKEKIALTGADKPSRLAYPENKTIAQLFEEQAAATPANLALVFEENALTYKQLNEQSNRLAAYLRANYTIQPDDLIGIKLERSEWVMVGVLAVLKSGAAYVPIDVDHPEERIQYMLADSQCKLLIDQTELDKFLAQQQDYPAANLPVINQPSDLAYIIYTSGSTGQPKGVMITNQSLVDYATGIIAKTNISECRTFGLVSTISADLGNTVIYTALLTGGTLHMFSASDVMSREKMSEVQLDCLKIVPSHWKALQEEYKVFAPAKCLIFGGEQLTMDIIDIIRSHQCTCHVYNHYGPSETTIGKLSRRIDVNAPDLQISLGTPIGNTQVYILDNEQQLVPKGVVGEICIGGDGLARGYLNKPALTAERFIADPFRKNERIYRTGDLGRIMADGTIGFIGRKDDQVKIRGYRIEPGEIAAVLTGFEGITAATVVAREDQLNEKRLVAYIVTRDTVSKAAIQAYLATRLPAYMVPGIYVTLAQLPLTSNGKIDRKALPLPEEFNGADTAAYVAPRNEVESKLVEIWSEVLGIDSSKIGVKDNFFDLGGHSLKAIRIILRIHEQLDVQIDLTNFFTEPDIESLATEVENIKWLNDASIDNQPTDKTII